MRFAHIAIVVREGIVIRSALAETVKDLRKNASHLAANTAHPNVIKIEIPNSMLDGITCDICYEL